MTELIPEGHQENSPTLDFYVWPEVFESEAEYSDFEDPNFEESNIEIGDIPWFDDLEPFDIEGNASGKQSKLIMLITWCWLQLLSF